MSWSAHLVDMMSGQRGPALDLVAAGAWTVTLDDVDDITVHSVWQRLAALDVVAWRHGVVVCWDDGGGPAPVCGGPVTGPPAPKALVGNAGEQVAVEAAGIREFLRYRIATGGDHGPGDESDLAAAVSSWSGVGRGTIGWRLVEQVMRKTSGWLPIVRDQPDDVADRTRSYDGWNVANNDVHKLLDDLTNTIDGPHFDFRPRWRDPSATAVDWVMAHGVEGSSQPPQTGRYTLDVQAPAGPISEAILTVGASKPATRVYGVGAGDGAGVLIRVAEDQPAGYPLMEQVHSESDVDNPALLEEKAAARLGVDPPVQLTVTWDGRVVCPPSRIRPGDQVTLWLPGVPGLVGEGRSEWLLIALKGKLDSPMVTGEFHPTGG